MASGEWPGKYYVRAHSKDTTGGDRALDVVIPTTGNYYLLFNDSDAPGCYSSFTFICPGFHPGEHDWLLVPEATGRFVLKHMRYMPAYAQTVGQK